MMTKHSRTKSSVFNVTSSLIEYGVKAILTFITRTIFIQKLGVDYLGLDGLFTNILSIMSVSELGLSGAIIFSLYRPIIDKDQDKINILLHIYKKCYFYIGCVILVAGLVLMPFLPKMITSSQDFGNVYALFGLYLVQTILTYWALAYKEAILMADQKKYKISIVTNVVLVFKFIAQLISLLVFNSFMLYIVSDIIMTIVRNLVISHMADRDYPYIKPYNGKKLEKKEKDVLVKNVFGMSLYRVSSTVMNSTDNIIISIFIDLAMTGLYSNYLLITMNIKGAISTIFSSLTASVGNLFAEGNKRKSEFIFRCINFLNFWVYGFVAICLWELLNPFITIWLGDSYLLGKTVVLAITLNFLTDGLQQAVIMYKDACGLFWKGKLRPVFSAGFNIVISLLLVKPLGILGVILGSVISRMITTWWFDPYLVYKNAFEMPVWGYFLRYLRSFIVIVLTAALIDGVMEFIHMGSFMDLLMRGGLCIVIPNTVFLMLFRKSEEYIYLKKIVLSKLKRKK